MDQIFHVGIGGGMLKVPTDLNEHALDGVSVAEMGSFTIGDSPGNPEPTSYWDKENEAGYNAIGLKNQTLEIFLRDDASKISRMFQSKQTALDINVSPKEKGDIKKALQLLRTYHGVLPIRYFIINASCPNKWKGEEQQGVTAHNIEATGILAEEAMDSPYEVLLKIAPDTPQATLVGLVDICIESKFSGIISGNTRNVETPLGANGKPMISMPKCGQSGKPLFAEAVLQVAALRKIINQKNAILHLSGMGGILQPEDAVQMFKAGADDVRIASLFYWGGGWKSATNLAASVNLG